MGIRIFRTQENYLRTWVLKPSIRRVWNKLESIFSKSRMAIELGQKHNSRQITKDNSRRKLKRVYNWNGPISTIRVLAKRLNKTIKSWGSSEPKRTLPIQNFGKVTLLYPRKCWSGGRETLNSFVRCITLLATEKPLMVNQLRFTHCFSAWKVEGE